jgi:hypothetical protein
LRQLPQEGYAVMAAADTGMREILLAHFPCPAHHSSRRVLWPRGRKLLETYVKKNPDGGMT